MISNKMAIEWNSSSSSYRFTCMEQQLSKNPFKNPKMAIHIKYTQLSSKIIIYLEALFEITIKMPPTQTLKHNIYMIIFNFIMKSTSRVYFAI